MKRTEINPLERSKCTYSYRHLVGSRERLRYAAATAPTRILNAFLPMTCISGRCMLHGAGEFPNVHDVQPHGSFQVNAAPRTRLQRSVRANRSTWSQSDRRGMTTEQDKPHEYLEMRFMEAFYVAHTSSRRPIPA
jgi:hypothetical protein